MKEHNIRIITDREEIERLIKKCSITAVQKEACNSLKNGASLVEVFSDLFVMLQQMNSNMFFAEVAEIMKNDFGAETGDYWFLTAALPRAPEKPVIYVVLSKKNM